MFSGYRRLTQTLGLATLLVGLVLVPSAFAAQRLGSRVLREGMSGSDVKALQRLLTEAGFTTQADGDFGPLTETSVVAFESAHQLTANGVVTSKDISVLRQAATGSTTSSTTAPSGASGAAAPSTNTTATKTATTTPTLKLGSQGHWVKVLQRDLSDVGFPTQVDGDFGPATEQSVNDFKTAHALMANGLIQKKAWAALRAAVKAADSGVSTSAPTSPPATAPGSSAVLNSDGLVTAPADAPTVVKEVIAAANKIAKLPYCYAGGHATWNDSCYDCSGSVGYALHGGGLLSVTEDSGEMEDYGSAGAGQWITLYTNAGHVYMKVAGLWFDTAAQSSSNGNDRWSTTRISPSSGFIVRHPTGY